jgi:demethylmenaquinone methyltransferase/2-methoxy-6-polyprenyl-1,4-benzoquinol methylase
MDKLKQIDKSDAIEWRKNVEYMFQEIADTYEKINTFISLGMDKGWRLKLLRRLKFYFDASHPVLDIGCGPGSLSALSKKHLPEARFLSSDICPRFLELAANSGNADEVLRLSASDLPFKDECLSAVTSAFVLRNLPDLERFYRECYRILRPGGVIAMLDLTQPKFKPISFFHSLYMALALPLGAKIYGSKIEAYEYLDRSIKNCLPPKEMKLLLEKCGFTVKHVDGLCLGTVTIYTAIKE